MMSCLLKFCLVLLLGLRGGMNGFVSLQETTPLLPLRLLLNSSRRMAGIVRGTIFLSGLFTHRAPPNSTCTRPPSRALIGHAKNVEHSMYLTWKNVTAANRAQPALVAGDDCPVFRNLIKTKILEGNVLETLKDLPDCSVQCVVTSPPYYGLRDYGMEGQIGLEETPEAYVETVVNVFREVRRVLKDDGTLWLNLGDSYWGGKGQSSQAWSTEHQERDTLQKSQHQITGKGETRPTDGKHPVIKPKDLIGIPWMVAFALRADGWYLRSEIIWAKPNPMPESMKDRPTKSHEQIFLLSKSAYYFYDADAIAEAALQPFGEAKETGQIKARILGQNGGTLGTNNGASTRNKRDVWTVNTHPYKGAHFATFPPKLIEPCILAGSRESDTVLDPFNGSGTTGAVAIEHNRNYIGLELNPDYIELSNRRIAEAQI